MILKECQTPIDVEIQYSVATFPLLDGVEVVDRTDELNAIKKSQARFSLNLKLIKKICSYFISQLFEFNVEAIYFEITDDQSFFSETRPFKDWKDLKAVNPLFQCRLSSFHIRSFEELAGTIYHEFSHVAESLHSPDFIQTHDGKVFNRYIELGQKLFPTLKPLVTKHDFKADKTFYASMRKKNKIQRSSMLKSIKLSRNTAPPRALTVSENRRQSLKTHSMELRRIDHRMNALQKARESLADGSKWTIEEVYEYFLRIFPDQAFTFKEQAIDGFALYKLERSDIVYNLNIKLGPALKIYKHIDMMQKDRKEH